MNVKILATAAIAIGLAAGSYGIASAASGSGTSSTSSSGLGLVATAAASTQPQDWGRQRPDETLLTGDTAGKVQAAAVAKEPGATVSRVETDADGNAAYEVHMIRSDGTLVTVYVDKSFSVVGVDTGMPGGSHGRAPAQQPTA